jgi:hypothetical protein
VLVTSKSFKPADSLRQEHAQNVMRVADTDPRTRYGPLVAARNMPYDRDAQGLSRDCSGSTQGVENGNGCYVNVRFRMQITPVIEDQEAASALSKAYSK